MKILDLEIDFPEIEGVSDRQIEYAEQLRFAYVISHEERFREIDEMVNREIDIRDIDYNNEPLDTFKESFSEEEKAVLYGISAGGIIARLKK